MRCLGCEARPNEKVAFPEPLESHGSGNEQFSLRGWLQVAARVTDFTAKQSSGRPVPPLGGGRLSQVKENQFLDTTIPI